MKYAPTCLAVLLLWLIVLPIKAQLPDSLAQVIQNRKSGIQFGILGNAPALSLNVHQQLFPLKTRHDKYIGFVSLAIGLGFVPKISFSGDNQWYPTFPHSLTANFGKLKHYFEFGYGGVVLNKEILGTSGIYTFAPIIGWRYKSAKGFMLRTYVSPLIHGKDEYDYSFDQNGQIIGSEIHSRLHIYPFMGITFGSSF